MESPKRPLCSRYSQLLLADDNMSTDSSNDGDHSSNYRRDSFASRVCRTEVKAK